MMVWTSSATGALEAMAASSARALLAACVVGGGLYALRVRNVAAQKIAWTLVLAGALLMPLLSPWMAQQAWMPHWLPDVHGILARMQKPVQAAVTPAKSKIQPVQTQATTIREAAPAWRIRQEQTVAAAVPQSVSTTETVPYGPQFPAHATEITPAPLRTSLIDTALALYLVIVAALLLRLFYGLAAAMQLWRDAIPAEFLAVEIPVRMHSEIPSPVTIGSGILLPADYAEWDTEKLRVVLAHESSHVQQRDFYLQLAAGIYAAVFWFSPLGWWLKRKLSDLGEAIGDRAAVNEAASRASYARLLLEFAEQSRDGWTQTTQFGVAMARTGRISHRIERLLNEQRFTQAFAGSRARLIGAAVLAPLAVFASAMLVHVEAHAQAAQPTPQTVSAPAIVQQTAPAQTPATGVSHPDTAPIETTQEPAPAPAPAPAPTTTQAPVAPAAPSPAPVTPQPPAPPSVDDQSNDTTVTNTNTDRHESHSAHDHGRNYSYSFFSSGGDSYAIIHGQGDNNTDFSGRWYEGMRPQIDKARSMAHGDFLWFTHDGKSYIVDDPAIVNEIQEMYKPMQALGLQQRELGRQQRELGEQQRELGRRMGREFQNPDLNRQIAELSREAARMRVSVRVEAPKIDQKQLDDLKQQIAQLRVDQPDFNAQMAKLSAEIARLRTPRIDTVHLDEMNARLAEMGSEISRRVTESEARMSGPRSELSKQMSDLGEQQCKLGEQQGKLGEQQGRMAQEANQKVRSIIDESLKNGTAKPVE